MVGRLLRSADGDHRGRLPGQVRAADPERAHLTRAIALAWATFFGAGFAPVAPGTAGSAAAALIALGASFVWQLHWWMLAAAAAFVAITGVPTCDVAEKKWGRDPSRAVVDEVAGQWIALIAVPCDWRWVLASFILFRAFDIAKPFPIHASQRLRGGFGVVIDDVLAGVYANVVLQLARLALR